MPASDLCPLADVTIEIRAQSQVRSIVNQEVKIVSTTLEGEDIPLTPVQDILFLKVFYPALKSLSCT